MSLSVVGVDEDGWIMKELRTAEPSIPGWRLLVADNVDDDAPAHAWLLYTKENYVGECVLVYDDLRSDLFRTQGLRSARPLPVNRRGIALFQHRDYRGQMLFTDEAIPDLRARGFNDTASSLLISGVTAWELFEHVDYSGRSVLLDSRRYGDPAAIGLANDTVSSLRPVP
ncbi:MAG: beta/gamma crystallin-related protein [Nannocystaceae bacterium]